MKQDDLSKKKKSLKVLIISCGIIFLVLVIGIEVNKHFFEGDILSLFSEKKTEEVAVKNDFLEETLLQLQDKNEREVVASPERQEGAETESEIVEVESAPITTSPIYPTDIYSEKNMEVVFKCYVEDATAYLWEFYDISSMNWLPMEGEAVEQKKDELYRDSSFCTLKANPENHEKLVRCTVSFSNQEALVKMATLYVLEKEVKDVSPQKTEYESGSYLSASEIPVTVTYKDDSQEVITGLNGLYFVDEREEREYSNSVSGNRVETITTVYTECDYIYLGEEQREIFLRYRKEDNSLDKAVVLCGKDYEPPVISALDISEYEVSAEDRIVPVTVTITAEDSKTPFPYLEYAFLPKEQEVTETDWMQKFAFEIDITQNGTWVAYCRDQSGNVSTEECRIITVDQKAPVFSLTLKESEWSNSNIIIVDAKDELAMQYLYSCQETGEDSGWITYSEYQVYQNGTWVVQVKDAVGNTASAKIEISNIDTQAPVINSIIVN